VQTLNSTVTSSSSSSSSSSLSSSNATVLLSPSSAFYYLHYFIMVARDFWKEIGDVRSLYSLPSLPPTRSLTHSLIFNLQEPDDKTDYQRMEQFVSLPYPSVKPSPFFPSKLPMEAMLKLPAHRTFAQ